MSVVVSTWVARANRSLLAFLTHKAHAHQAVDIDTLRNLVREKNRIARQTEDVPDPEYDEMRAGIMQRFEELASVQD